MASSKYFYVIKQTPHFIIHFNSVSVFSNYVVQYYMCRQNWQKSPPSWSGGSNVFTSMENVIPLDCQ